MTEQEMAERLSDAAGKAVWWTFREWSGEWGASDLMASVLMALDPENTTGYFHGDPPWPEEETAAGRAFLSRFADLLASTLAAPPGEGEGD